MRQETEYTTGSPAETGLGRALWSLEHRRLLDALADSPRLLLIQDLDGVCMGLVRDPLTRRLDPDYLAACRELGDAFYVLTNGEHIGKRGVNRLVDAALGDPQRAREDGWYLPGLAGGGVQLQDAHGRVTHPGVADAELAFLRTVPPLARRMLQERLSCRPFELEGEELRDLVESCVLDNAVSPTLNLNPLYARFSEEPSSYRLLQDAARDFLQDQLREAMLQGLDESFFIHLAPNAGRDESGERMRPCSDTDAGTTDFQLMLSGAVKEVGVLVLLNHYFYRCTGRYPLGANFNAREAPRDPEQLLALAEAHFPARDMPRIVAIGDTVTSHRDPDSGSYQRGGSDRGFLTLVQELGKQFSSDNSCLLVDSSAGEVRRPGVDLAGLTRGKDIDYRALAGISDPEDPLRINFLFPGGHAQYLKFFSELARRRSARRG